VIYFLLFIVMSFIVLCCRMDKVIASILVLIAAFILQYLWQYYRTMTDEDGVAIAVDVTEPVSHRDEPDVLSLQVFSHNSFPFNSSNN